MQIIVTVKELQDIVRERFGATSDTVVEFDVPLPLDMAYDFCKKKQLLNAVKVIRESYGLSLFESKVIVDVLAGNKWLGSDHKP